jgi:glutamate synthase domain-containing protein 3
LRGNTKQSSINLDALLTLAQKPHKNTGTYQTKTQDHELTSQLDNALIEQAKNAIHPNHKQIVDHMFWLASKFLTQFFVLRGNTDWTGIEVAFTHHNTAHGDERRSGKTKFFRAQKPHKNTGTYQTKTQDHELTSQLDNALIEQAKNAIHPNHGNNKVRFNSKITNIHNRWHHLQLPR